MLEVNKIYLGDCFELMKEIPDKSVDCILTDPPYGITACKWDVKLDLEVMWGEFKRICKGNIIIFGTQPFTSQLIMSNLKMFKYELVWLKNMVCGFAFAKTQPMRKHENILVFYEKFTTYNPQMIKRTQQEFDACYRRNNSKINFKGAIYGKAVPDALIRKPKEEQWYKLPHSILEFKKDVKRNHNSHNTQKPLEIIKWLIRTYTNENMLVFDPFLGSGTTAVACKELKRQYIGIEKEEQYFKIAQRRIDEVNNLL